MTPAPRGQRGFTLLELLIAITLLGLIMTMAFSGLRLGTRAWEAADAHHHDIYLVQQMLRTRLAAAYFSPEFGPTRLAASGEEEWLFDGRPDRVSFVAPLPELFGVGGLYRITVGAVGGGGGAVALAMSWRLLGDVDDADADPGARARDRRVLLAGAEDIAFAYFGPDPTTGAYGWQDGWRERETLPALVRIAVAHPDEAWPPLVVAPKLAADGIFQWERPETAGPLQRR
jgi:general secretion pathway protein J